MKNGPLTKLAEFAYRRRRRVIAAWVVLLVATIALAPAIAGEFEADYSTPGSESATAADVLEDHFPATSDETVDVVWQSPSGAASHEGEMQTFLARAERLEGIGDAQEPRTSRDGTVAMAALDLDRPAWDVPVETGERLIGMAEETSGNGLRIELGGGPIIAAEDGGSPEMAGILAAAVILLVAFGSFVAAGLPILTALFGLGISASLIGVLAAVMDVPEWAPAVASLVGIGVGIDYALLVLTRFRTALHRGAGRREAIVEAVSTAGRSVVVAGTIVMVSLLGMFVMGASYMYGVAISAALAVLVVMAAAVTLVPAVLAVLGPRIDRLRVPGLGGALHPEQTRLATRWSRAVQRRPWTAAIAGAGVLIALTVPVTELRLGFPDAGNNPADSTTRAAYELMSDAFGPGSNGPLLVAAEIAPGSEATLERMATDLRKTRNVAFVSEPRISPDRQAALVVVAPGTTPQDEKTEDLVHTIRHDVLPDTGLDAHVGGITASFIDQSEQMSERLPLFIGAVVGLSFLLLLVAFRAPVIALKAGVMNLLSVGAAYGVVALVAQGGAVGELIGIDTSTPVPPFIPVMMFALLFGLSMDYEVFLLSRIREEFLRHGDTKRAVAEGLAKTARVITAAAAIMVAVFLAFILSSETFLKLMGVGMATAIFVDATVIRMILVPSVMQLMGRANWWAPRWLERSLPRFDLERPAPAEGRP
jgi:RND superfamily putative drug exporter